MAGIAVRTVGALLLAVGVAGCGSGDDSGDGGGNTEDVKSAPSSPTEAALTVNVQMTDAPPLDVLFNGGKQLCTTVNVAQLLEDALGSNGGTPTSDPVTVTVRDASGTIVGTQTLPEVGGSFTKATGCVWAVSFDDVPASDFYEATVAVAQDEYKGTGQASGGAVLVEVQI